MKNLRRILAAIMMLSMIMSLMGGAAFAEETEPDPESYSLITVVNVSEEPIENSEEPSPYWTEETELEGGTTESVTHAVLDNEGELVDIGAEPDPLDTTNLEPGNMTAQKHGAFENEADAEDGIVKITFDVAGKPVEVESPVDMLIIADESGSMNMYGRADTTGDNTSYMPCLNDKHYYAVDGLQSALYNKAINNLDKNSVAEVRNALEADSAAEEGAESSAVEQLVSAKNDAVAQAEEAAKLADAALTEAQAAYDAASEEEKAELKAALDSAQSSAESAKAGLDAAQAQLSAVSSALELLNKQANTNAQDTTYINPHSSGLENIVFKQWDDSEEGRAAVIAMVEAAGIEVPEGISGTDVLKLLFPTKADTPDKNHYYYDAETGEYKAIDYVENSEIIEEELNTSKNGLYSYWSPEYDNEYGCIDRMMLEKLAASNLAESILDNPNSAVGYIGFTYSSYPSICSGGFMTADDIDELLDVIEKTEGHDYTNYVHALWTAKDYIENRENTDKPVYIVFISDGVPSRFSTEADKEWNTIDTPVKGDDGDCLGYNDIQYGDTNYTHVTAAMHVAEELKKWYNEEYGTEMDFYTVGINTNDSANEVLGSIASDENHFIKCDDPNKLANTLLDTIDPYHVKPSGVLTDKIGEDFELYVDDSHLFTVSGQTYNVSAIEAVLNSMEENAKLGNVVSFQVKLPEGTTTATIKDVVAITWEVNEVDENGDSISYYVQLKSEELDKFEAGTTRLYDTNADTAAEAGANLVYYELSTNEDGTEYFVAKDPTTIELRTPQMMIINSNSSVEDTPAETPTEEVVPVAVELTAEEEITEEPVPLAEAPQTGSFSALWLISLACSGTGLAGLSLINRRKSEEE